MSTARCGSRSPRPSGRSPTTTSPSARSSLGPGGERHRRRPQRARAPARTPAPTPRCSRIRAAAARGRLLAPAGHHALRHARALRDVRRRDRPRPHPARRLRHRRPQGRRRGLASSTSSPSPASTTARRSSAASCSPSARRCCWTSSPPGAAESLPSPAHPGGVREWLNRAVSKTVERVTPVPRVRIPPPPLRAGHRRSQDGAPALLCPCVRGSSLRCNR